MEIPLPNKFNDSRKNNPASAAPKSESEPVKPHNSVEEYKASLPALMSKWMEINGDKIKNFYQGDIEYPTEFDKFIPEKINDGNVDEYRLAQTAWVAKTSAYIALHLQKWMNEKVADEIEQIYERMSEPFTLRVMAIIPDCERMLNELPSTMPAFQERFREKYLQLRSVAKRADEEQSPRSAPVINSFKLAAKFFDDTVMTIYSEACVAIKQLTQPAKENVQSDPARTKQTDSPAKGNRLWNYFLDLYERTLKAAIDAVLGKVWPK